MGRKFVKIQMLRNKTWKEIEHNMFVHIHSFFAHFSLEMKHVCSEYENNGTNPIYIPFVKLLSCQVNNDDEGFSGFND